MFRWAPYVFVRITIFFIAGVVLAINFPDPIDADHAKHFLLALVGIYGLLFFFPKKVFASVLGFTGLAFIFLGGFVHLHLKTDSRQASHILNIDGPVSYYLATVSRFAQNKEKSWKIEAEVEHVRTSTWSSHKGKLILYFSKESFNVPFSYGDVLLIKGAPQLITPPGNPGEFDYKKFLSTKNIYHQDFIRSADAVTFVEHRPSSGILKAAYQARIWAEAQIASFVYGEREQAIASALVLGVTDGLDDDLLSAYAATGSMHVLAVSGLHVGIIYWILMALLRPLKNFRRGLWLIAIIGLVVLWSYAFITGLSPSVFRAVTMFSFMAIAKPMGKNTNIYNTLAASAFCILLVDPYLVMSVGFQLSYLAVIGIVYFQPGLYRLWSPRSRLLDEVWKIISVSVAAQITTFSLGLLYFHQFPNYFIISNLVVIPASFLVLLFGIALIAASAFTLVAEGIGFLLTWCTKGMNFAVFAIERLPFSLTEDIYISAAQCWLLMLMIALSSLLWTERKLIYLYWIFALAIGFASIQWHRFDLEVDGKKFIVYNIRRQHAIEFLDGGKSVLLADPGVLADPQIIKFHVHPYRLKSGVTITDNSQAPPFQRSIKGGSFVTWNGIAFLIIKGQTFSALKFDVDYVIISNNSVEHLSQVFNQFSSTLILDSSNSYFYSKRLKAEAQNLGLDVHAVLLDGAFERKIMRSGL